MIKKILNWFRPNKKPVFSFRQGFDLTELPIITLYQGEKKFNFILDTGSNNNMINKEILGTVEYESTNMNSLVAGKDGKTENNNVYKMVFSYEDRQFPFYYVATDLSTIFGAIKKESGVTLHGILGSRFFNTYRYVLDFQKLVAYIK